MRIALGAVFMVALTLLSTLALDEYGAPVGIGLSLAVLVVGEFLYWALRPRPVTLPDDGERRQ